MYDIGCLTLAIFPSRIVPLTAVICELWHDGFAGTGHDVK